jgi:hypothetical protein
MQKQIMVIDPTLQYERRLKYLEKHGGWEVFKMIFWGSYIFIIGMILLIFYKTSPTQTISLYAFFGWSLIIFAMFYIVYGFALSLHYKLMRKYA